MYTQILVPLDGTSRSERILPWVSRLARGSDSTVRLLTVRPPARAVVVARQTVAYDDQVEARALAEALRYLRVVAARLEEDGIPVAMEVRFGNPARTILEAARESGADLIAMAARSFVEGRGLMSRSVTSRVLRRARVPVLVARSSDQRAA